MNMKGSNAEVEALPMWKVAFKNWYKFPWIELFVVLGAAAVAYIGFWLISLGMSAPPGAERTPGYLYSWISGLFFISLGIGFLGTLTGIGGGVIWSPLCMAFTPMDSLVIRSSGLIIAMYNALVACGPLTKRGLMNLRLIWFLLVVYGIGCFGGAQGAVIIYKYLGKGGEGIIRIILGLIILIIIIYFLTGGKKAEYPEVKKVDGFTRWFRTPLPFYEASLQKVIDYQLRLGWLCWIAVFFIGMMGGFFGMGGGWAMTPAVNAIMGAPLKVAAGTSMGILGMGDCIAVWPYFLAGAMIPLITAPLLAGQVVGGLIGAYVMIGIKAMFVRFILIGVLMMSCFGLITKGCSLLGWFSLPPWVRLGFGIPCALFVFYLIGREYGWWGR
jgi:uncharacterized membrane protein YfcA